MSDVGIGKVRCLKVLWEKFGGWGIVVKVWICCSRWLFCWDVWDDEGL